MRKIVLCMMGPLLFTAVAQPVAALDADLAIEQGQGDELGIGLQRRLFGSDDHHAQRVFGGGV